MNVINCRIFAAMAACAPTPPFLILDPPLSQGYTLCIKMDLHLAKRTAFQKCCNQFRRAIIADPEDLRYELYTAGLISMWVRNRRDADDTVSAVENKLRDDDSAWDALIEVLHESGGGATLARRLTDQLTVELSRKTACGGNIPLGQWPNRGGSPAR